MIGHKSNRLNDTCFGINNEGQLVLDYWHEDTDQLEGANVYNGQNSTLWVNFREAFADEIKETYQQLRSDGKLTYDILEDRFITQGSDKWSESVYNEDSEFKYISMLKSDNDASNLPQVRGSGEEHFRYFIKNRINYCDSKWYASDYANDYVSLRIYTPVDSDGAPRTDLIIPACADITVTPYSNMYTGVRYKANGTLYQERSEHSVPVTFEAPDEVFNDTETAIYGASQLSSLGDLAPLYCGSVNVAKADKLIELKVGDSTEGYSNPNLHDLSVGTNNLLKKIDIRNCPKLTTSLSLTGCPNIEEVYATGTGITSIELVDGGILKIAHLPETITNLTLKNQMYIEDFTLDGYANIKTLHIENCPAIDTWELLSEATSLERLRLTNVDWTFDNADVLMGLATRGLGGIDEYGYNIDDPHISGKAYIESLTGEEFAQIAETFPYLDISYGSLTSQLIFMSWDGSEELHRITVTDGGDSIDPVVNLLISTPTRESTAQYDFTYCGWSKNKDSDEADEDALLKVEADRIVYTAFTKTLRYYTVKFYSETTLLETQSVGYGYAAYYSGGEPEKIGVTDPEDYEFLGWSPSPSKITGDMSCYAQYAYIGNYVSRKIVERSIDFDYENDRITFVGDYGFAGFSKLTNVDLPNVTSVGNYGFGSCKKLTNIELPSATTIGKYAFELCSNLTSVNLPVAETIGEFAFTGCTKIVSVCFPSAKTIEKSVFYHGGTEQCKMLRIVDLPVIETIKDLVMIGRCYAMEALILRNTNAVCKLGNAGDWISSLLYIYVPSSLIESYKVTANWSTYADRFRALEDYTVDGTTTGELDETKISGGDS